MLKQLQITAGYTVSIAFKPAVQWQYAIKLLSDLVAKNVALSSFLFNNIYMYIIFSIAFYTQVYMSLHNKYIHTYIRMQAKIFHRLFLT